MASGSRVAWIGGGSDLGVGDEGSLPRHPLLYRLQQTPPPLRAGEGVSSLSPGPRDTAGVLELSQAGQPCAAVKDATLHGDPELGSDWNLPLAPTQ